MAAIFPASVPNMSTAVTEAVPDAAAIRLGTVVGHGPTYLQVRVSDSASATDAGWLASYEPVLGDVVVISRQSAAWVRVRMQFTSWAAAAGDTIYLDRMIARSL